MSCFTFKVSLEGSLARLDIKQQAAELDAAMRTINYPCTVLASLDSLEVSIYDPNTEDPIDELTDKLCEAGMPAYVEEL